MTARELAAIAQASLTRGERLSDNTYKQIVVRTDDAPPWVADLCAAAGLYSDNTLDWDFEFIEDALSELDNADEDEWDDVRMDADEYYPYTRDQLNWLSSTLINPSVCDTACEEYAVDRGNLMSQVSVGMTYAMNVVLDNVRRFLLEKAEEMTTEEEEADRPEEVTPC